ARLGIVTGKDLAQACRDFYPEWTRLPLWLFCEIAIGACDLAEVLGSAVAINLLFHIPLLWAVIINAFDVLLLLGLLGMGMRVIAVAINLLFHIPLMWAVLITALDVLLLLALQGLGMRFIEAVILLLVATIGGCYFIEIFVLPHTQPDFLDMGKALLTPGFRQ